MITTDTVEAALARVHDRIRAAGGDPRAVTVVAVTKGFGPDALRAAMAAGLVEVGESYAQEAGAKLLELDDAERARLHVHFIGRLQRNKVRTLAPLVTLWQSLDRPELAREIAKRAPGAAALVQLDLSGEPQKGGCSLDEAPGLVAEARRLGLDVRGLMGVAPAGPPDAARPGFAALVALADQLDLPVRSIGMSGDLEVAVEEGATMVRLGRDLFGPRPGGRGGPAVELH